MPRRHRDDNDTARPWTGRQERRMRIVDFFRTDLAEIEARQWNPYLGISIQNKTFTADYVHAFAEWAADRASERVAIVVVDVLQRINNQVLNRSKPMAAIEKAFRKADEVHALCDEALDRLAPGQRGKIVVLDWCDIFDDEYFLHNASVFNTAFAADREFHDFLVGLTRANLGPIVERLDESQVELLATYMLHELPELATGFLHGGIHYNLNVYPGRIASIYADLLAQPFFPGIARQLHTIGKYACIEAY
jgi:tRNA-dependent cyclodipeptide synthase